MQAILGQKIDQSEKFLMNGTRIPVTKIKTAGNVVMAIKHSAVQLGFGSKKKKTKNGGKIAPRFLREVKAEEGETLEVGSTIKASEVFQPGDFIYVEGTSKGKGFAGVVKRHHFKGGPRTHGQSDRERAPGSIGQTTTPGRVYKGKRMAGKMGAERVTVKNLTVIDVSDDFILVKGLIPGSLNSIVLVKKVGENKKFVPLFKEAATTEVTEAKNENTESSISEVKEKNAS